MIKLIFQKKMGTMHAHHKAMATNLGEPFVHFVYPKSRKNQQPQIKIHTGIPTTIRIITTVVISILPHCQSFECLIDL